MRAFKGREFIQNNYPHNKRHEILLEDDDNFLEYADKEEMIWCGIDQEEAKKIIEFISNSSILGINNKAVNITNEFKNLLKKTIEG